MINYSDFVIDFERLNQLTSHQNDTTSSASFGQSFIYGISRKVLKEYMDIWTTYNGITDSPRKGRITEGQYKKACETLRFNRILVTSSDLRDRIINQVLEDDDCPF